MSTPTNSFVGSNNNLSVVDSSASKADDATPAIPPLAAAATDANQQKQQQQQQPLPEAVFDSFYAELKDIEKRDAVLTSKQQIDRLLRPGSSYANLNPFDVLQMQAETPLDQMKKQFRKLSLLVHPDKNPDARERAQAAFDAVNKAWKMLDDEGTRAKCMLIAEEAKARTNKVMQDKKKKLKSQGRLTQIEEDDPVVYKRTITTLTMKLFADLERRRRDEEAKSVNEKKKRAAEEAETAEKVKVEKEWKTNYEESRTDRVDSWRSFQTEAPKAKKVKTAAAAAVIIGGGFKMPKNQPEKR